MAFRIDELKRADVAEAEVVSQRQAEIARRALLGLATEPGVMMGAPAKGCGTKQAGNQQTRA